MPQPRSGHSAIVHGQKMYIFGGIFELTKEVVGSEAADSEVVGSEAAE